MDANRELKILKAMAKDRIIDLGSLWSETKSPDTPDRLAAKINWHLPKGDAVTSEELVELNLKLITEVSADFFRSGTKSSDKPTRVTCGDCT